MAINVKPLRTNPSWETDVTPNDTKFLKHQFVSELGGSLWKDSHWQVNCLFHAGGKDSLVLLFLVSVDWIDQIVSSSSVFLPLVIISSGFGCFWKCNRKPKITSSCQNEPDLPPTQLLSRLFLLLLLVSCSFSPLVQLPLSSAAGEFWKPRLLLLAAPLTRLTSLSNSEESALITDLWRMWMWRSGLRETTRVHLMRSGCFVSAVCRGVTAARLRLPPQRLCCSVWCWSSLLVVRRSAG